MPIEYWTNRHHLAFLIFFKCTHDVIQVEKKYAACRKKIKHMYTTNTEPFEIRTSKSSVFKCFCYSNGWYSDYHCISIITNMSFKQSLKQVPTRFVYILFSRPVFSSQQMVLQLLKRPKSNSRSTRAKRNEIHKVNLPSVLIETVPTILTLKVKVILWEFHFNW